MNNNISVNIRKNSNMNNVFKRLNIDNELLNRFKDWLNIMNIINKENVKKNEMILNKNLRKEYYIKKVSVSKRIINKIGFIVSVINEINDFFNSSSRNDKKPSFIRYNPKLFEEIYSRHGNKNYNIGNYFLDNNSNKKVLHQIFDEYLEGLYKDDSILNNKIKKKYQKSFNNLNLHLFSFYVLRQVKTKDIYVTFPGFYFEKIDFNNLRFQDHFYFLKFYFQYVLDYLSKIQNRYDNIILGGNSFGCSSAQYLGNKICKNKELRNLMGNKIWIVGTGPFRWINENDLENFNQFYQRRKLIFGLLKDEYIDSIIYSKISNLIQSDILFIKYSKNNDNEIVIKNLIKANQSEINEKIREKEWIYYYLLGKEINSFNNYYNVLKKLVKE